MVASRSPSAIPSRHLPTVMSSPATGTGACESGGTWDAAVACAPSSRAPRESPIAPAAPSDRNVRRCMAGTVLRVRRRGNRCVSIELGFGHRPGDGRCTAKTRAVARREHGTTRRTLRREPEETDIDRHVAVHRFHSPTHEVGFVPEAGAARITLKLLPPDTVRLGTRPALECIEVAPVLPHPDV